MSQSENKIKTKLKPKIFKGIIGFFLTFIIFLTIPLILSMYNLNLAAKIPNYLKIIISIAIFILILTIISIFIKRLTSESIEKKPVEISFENEKGYCIKNIYLMETFHNYIKIQTMDKQWFCNVKKNSIKNTFSLDKIKLQDINLKVGDTFLYWTKKI